MSEHSIRKNRTKNKINYKKEDIENLRALAEIKMSWIAFYTIIILFFVCLLALVFESFYFHTGWDTKALLLFINATLAFGFKRIFTFLFPTPK